MGQEDIYRVLLELKETTGKTEATLDDIKVSLVTYIVKHDKLQDKHNELQASHDSFKGKILLVSSGVGAIFGALGTWFYKTFVN